LNFLKLLSIGPTP